MTISDFQLEQTPSPQASESASSNIFTSRERTDEELSEHEALIDGLIEAVRFLGPHAEEFAPRVELFLMEYELQRRRVERMRGQLEDALDLNQRLSHTLHEAKLQIGLLQEDVNKLCAPPNGYGVLESVNKDETLEINVDGRRMRVHAGPDVQVDTLMKGQLVVLNEAFNVVGATGFDGRGEVMQVSEVLDDRRLLVLGRGDEERVIALSDSLRDKKLNAGDHILVNARTGFALEKLPRSRVDEVVLEEVPDVSYDNIGGLGDQIEVLRDAIELPYLHAEEFQKYELAPPKGILLYGPPGCGKTMIGKAVANELARRISQKTGKDAQSYFLNVKGPELLNKYVGETEHKIREVFKKAREKADEDVPVVVFFDEMESLLRMRGSGVSSDIEATVVAQFLAEIDGVESLSNVIVIGATNRPDLIDPAVLRPGRLDLKVKVQRPDASGAREILRKYLTPNLPLARSARERFGPDPELVVAGIVDLTVEHMYAETDDNRFLEVTYAKGDREVLHFKDFSSGAMLRNIVDRAKKKAVKRAIRNGERGIGVADLLESVREEFKENEDLPNTTNPDDWARISGQKGERIIAVRTLLTKLSRNEPAAENIVGSGQYL